MKKYNTFDAFRREIFKKVTKSKQERILFTLVSMGYAEKKVRQSPYNVTYGFPPSMTAKPTEQDVNLVADRINSRK